MGCSSMAEPDWMQNDPQTCSCSNGLAKPWKRGNTVFGDAHVFGTSKGFHQNIKKQSHA